jgi:hypothetical protein
MPYANKEAYMAERNCRSYFRTTPQVVGTSKDIYSKSSDSFRERISNIKKGYPTKGPNKVKMDGW